MFESGRRAFEGRPVFGLHVPPREYKRRIDYRIVEVRDDIVRVERTYRMQTGKGPSDAPAATMTGEGSFTFDRAAGVIDSASMNYTLVLNDSDSGTITATIS